MRLHAEWSDCDDDFEYAWRVVDADQHIDGNVICTHSKPHLKFARKRDAEIAAHALSRLAPEEVDALSDDQIRKIAFEHLQW